MSEFDGIKGFDGWSKKLEELLVAAAKASQTAGHAERFEQSRRLREFIRESHPTTPDIEALDEIAKKAAIGLLEQSIDDRLKSMAERDAELAQLAKQFGDAASSAKATAASIRLERAKKALVAINDGILKMKELRELLKTGSDQDLAKALDKAIEVSQSARRLIESR